MDYEEWQLKRRVLQEAEKKERSINWQQSRAPIQAAITEQAVRELYDLTASIGERLAALEQKRGPGRPPNEVK